MFARALGLPNDPIEATGVLLEALRTGSTRAVSLGRADDRYFLFAAGHGFDAGIVGRVERRRRRGQRNTDSLYARLGAEGVAGLRPAHAETARRVRRRRDPRRGLLRDRDELGPVDVRARTGRCDRRLRSTSTTVWACTPAAG